MIEFATDTKGRLLSAVGGEPIMLADAFGDLSARPFTVRIAQQEAVNLLRRNLAMEPPTPAQAPGGIMLRFSAPHARIERLSGYLECDSQQTSLFDLLTVTAESLERALNSLPVVHDGGGVKVYGSGATIRRFRIVWNEAGERETITRTIEPGDFGSISCCSSEVLVPGTVDDREIVDFVVRPFPQVGVAMLPVAAQSPSVTTQSAAFGGDGYQIDELRFPEPVSGFLSYRVGTDAPTRPLSVHGPTIRIQDAIETASPGKIQDIINRDDGLDFVHAVVGAQDPVEVDDALLVTFPTFEITMTLRLMLLDLALTGQDRHEITFEAYGVDYNGGGEEDVSTQTIYQESFTIDLSEPQMMDFDGNADWSNPLAQMATNRTAVKSAVYSAPITVSPTDSIALTGVTIIRSDSPDPTEGVKTAIGSVDIDSGRAIYPLYEIEDNINAGFGVEGLKQGSAVVTLDPGTEGTVILQFRLTETDSDTVTDAEIDLIIS